MSLTVALFCPKVEGLKGRLNVPCAHCLAIEGTFGDQIAEQRLERMREEKIEPTTAWLVETGTPTRFQCLNCAQW